IGPPTSCSPDWSSAVCASDLRRRPPDPRRPRVAPQPHDGFSPFEGRPTPPASPKGSALRPRIVPAAWAAVLALLVPLVPGPALEDRKSVVEGHSGDAALGATL